MVFDIQNKVVLITGGASGLGLIYAKELLSNGVKGVALADVSSEQGVKAVKEVEKIYGENKAIFVKTDVTVFEQFEHAFQETIKKFQNVDILINNAGILNDAIWEKEILININGTVHGMILGMDKYFPKYKQGNEAIIVNISSIAGTQGCAHVPVYTATKHAILGLIRSWCEFYEETKVKVIGVCPGTTMTPLITEIDGRTMTGDKYERYLKAVYDDYATQEPEFMGTEVIKVIKHAPNGTSWVIEGGEPPYQYIVPDRSSMKNNSLPVN